MEALTVSEHVDFNEECLANNPTTLDPAVQVFGWGSWLKENSNTVEAEQFAKKFQEKTVRPHIRDATPISIIC